MTPELNGGLEANYSVNDQFGIDYDIFGGSLTLNYSFSPRTLSYFRAAYVQRQSDAALAALSPLSSDVSDTIVTIGIRRQL
jgi:predicted porin